ncbi:MAG: hypothetical protein ACPG4U_01685 [Pseudomonadales bacterium]
MRLFTAAVLFSLSISALASQCVSGLYVQGGQHCTSNRESCDDKYLFRVNCASEVTLEMLRPSLAATKYGYRAGMVRYRGSEREGTFTQFFPSQQCGGPVTIETPAALTFKQIKLVINYQRKRYNETRCKVQSSDKRKTVQLLKVDD